MKKDKEQEVLLRWRMVLGKFSSGKLSLSLSARQRKMEAALDFIYSREYAGRGIWKGAKQQGTLDPSQLTVPSWIKEIKKLFPEETIKTIEKHALEKYKIKEIIEDKEILKNLEPDFDLLKMLLTFKGHLNRDVLDEAKKIIAAVVEEIKRELSRYVRQVLSGRLNRLRRSNWKVAHNFDWKNTIKKNLKHYHREYKTVLPETLCFFSQVKKTMPWEIILCVDQSGSMLESVIYSSVLASIFSGMPALSVKLIIFDTSVVDLTAYIDDPVEILMGVQLGGGTNIGRAMMYCEQLINYPHRTILVLITDFCEGAPPRVLYNSCRRLVEAGVRLLGLVALDEDVHPVYDKEITGNLSSLGMDIAALTPKELTQWLKNVLS
ncbi:MAG: VWA domain-containing protein [Spirochaetales bacterium]|nr:VWA domain-containing protein [Spirochaetales bacterium]